MLATIPICQSRENGNPFESDYGLVDSRLRGNDGSVLT